MARAILIAAALAGVVAGQKLPVVPGVGLIGRTFDLLSFNMIDFIFNLTFYENQRTPDQNYLLPDYYQYVDSPECNFLAQSNSTNKFAEYLHMHSHSFSIGGSFGGFGGSFSSGSQTVHQTIADYAYYVSLSTATCTVYTMFVVPEQGAMPVLSDEFVANAQALPEAINDDDDLRAYWSFLDYWGQYMITGCNLGGSLSQIAFTTTTYVLSYQSYETSHQAGFSFIVSIDSSSQDKTQITEQYTSSTSQQTVVNNGGIYPSQADNWGPWAQSIEEYQNLACASGIQAIQLSDVFNMSADAGVQARAAPMSSAINAYFTRPGCTNPIAVNYNASALQDDGSCKYSGSSLQVLPDAPDVETKVLGMWQCQSNLPMGNVYVLPGASPYGNAQYYLFTPMQESESTQTLSAISLPAGTYTIYVQSSCMGPVGEKLSRKAIGSVSRFGPKHDVVYLGDCTAGGDVGVAQMCTATFSTTEAFTVYIELTVSYSAGFMALYE